MTKEKLAWVVEVKMAQLAEKAAQMGARKYEGAVAALQRWAAYQAQFVEA